MLLDVDGRSDRATEVVSREEPDGDATLDQDLDGADTGDAPRRPDELADASPERRGIASAREAGAEVDGDDAPRHRDREQWCPPRDRRTDATRTLGRRRARQESPTAPSIVAPAAAPAPVSRRRGTTRWRRRRRPPERRAQPPRGREVRRISCQLDSSPGRASPTENRQRRRQGSSGCAATPMKSGCDRDPSHRHPCGKGGTG